MKVDIKIGDIVIHEGGGHFEIVEMPGYSKIFPDGFRGRTQSGTYGLFPEEEVVSVNGQRIIRENSPTRKQWSGPEDGLPPIGSECTIEDNGLLQYGSDHAGKPMEVVAHVEDCAVLRLDWGLGCFNLAVLKPIRTEKERVVESAMKHMPYPGSPSTLADLGAAFDAGFLKMPENDQ